VGLYLETGRNNLFTTDPVPLFEGTPVDNLNSLAGGLGAQVGISFEAGVRMNVMGELGVNINYPGLLGFHIGVAYEVFPFDSFGIGLGAGGKRARLTESEDPVAEGTETLYPYLRAGLLFKPPSERFNNVSLYFDFLFDKGWSVGFAFF
jgi:hypothetical protein